MGPFLPAWDCLLGLLAWSGRKKFIIFVKISAMESRKVAIFVSLLKTQTNKQTERDTELYKSMKAVFLMEKGTFHRKN